MFNNIYQAWHTFLKKKTAQSVKEDARISYTETTLDNAAVAKLHRTFSLNEKRFDEEILAPIHRVFRLISEGLISEKASDSLQQRSVACAEQAARAIGDAIFSGSELPGNRYEKDLEWQIGIFITALLFPLIKEWKFDVEHALKCALPTKETDQKIMQAMKATLCQTECNPKRFSKIVLDSYDRVCNKFLTP